MIGFNQKIFDLAVTALVNAGVPQAQAEQIATDNTQACVDQINGFRTARQDVADKASRLDPSQYPAPSNPRYDVYAWQAAFVDFQAWVQANLMP